MKIENLKELQEAFRKMPTIVLPELRHTVREVSALILETEKKEAPIDKGALRRGITIRQFDVGASIGPTHEYALYVHEGTGVHGKRGDYIRPRNAKVLAFKGKSGKMIFTKRVAGQKANPFVKRTVEQTEEKVNAIINRTLDNIISKI